MAEDKDLEIAIGHVVDMVGSGLVKRKAEGIELERRVRNFWNKIKKGMADDVVANLEAEPEDEAARKAFAEELERLMKSQNVKMSVVALLFNSGIRL
ncbi:MULTISPECIES: hypothetical protein [unclassified Aureispira]|uniref:hypothetical protein n=1 Tax=unclassified Aureispira TaxID=2649989 RepID=UPI0006967CB9|nr:MULTISPECIES: hypothetical protein [unclassified Aureispira]WMX13034.1 hypothetical protein QP953_19530 [Aureispira sp. CCB-E]